MSESFTQCVKNEMRELVDDNCSGLLREICAYHLENSGKMLRPQMIQNLGAIYSASPKDLILWATCLELFHNASLVHDDLQDQDEVRRSKPSVWKVYGFKQAINAGDFLMMLSHRALEKIDNDRLKLALARCFSQTASKLVEGQSLEFQLASLDPKIQLRKEYLRCASLKTGALFSCLAEGVGIIAGLEELKLRKLSTFFEDLGVLFQMQDDVLDLYGNKGREETGCDIKEGKLSFLALGHFENPDADPKKMAKILLKKREDTTREDINFLTDEFKESGTLAMVMKEIINRTEELMQREVLSENTALSPLVNGLISKMLSPIMNVKNIKEAAYRV